MQNLLVEKHLCYLLRAEHEHILEGLSLEELHHRLMPDVEVAGEERPAVSRLVPRTAVTVQY